MKQKELIIEVLKYLQTRLIAGHEGREVMDLMSCLQEEFKIADEEFIDFGVFDQDNLSEGAIYYAKNWRKS